ncbi:DUF221-domain-containing protein [Pleurostoma richardsiae]|uniref:DUF221-domain-containing protein n=1 Tax=Pleurostoma richardsiae TaxID=41990 RepID=A0AA38VIQ5_9PEZI|nr:DUF221-domain-containing protein [Pleurostoma richardsiae]
MDILARGFSELLRRDDDDEDPAQELLKLIQNPFASSLQASSFWASVGSSIGITAGIALLFSFVRPYNSVVYAPKLKHADEAHAPPPLGKGMFAWVGPLWKTSEQDLVRLVGLDATLFMRFLRMLRNMFVVLAIISCAVLIPINYTQSSGSDDQTWLSRLTPSMVGGEAHWGQVVVAWAFDIIICGFLWWNYRKVLQLRRAYFESDEYQHSLHARTLMLYDIPKKFSSDEGIARIIDSVVPNSSFSRTAIARNVKILPELIQEHDKTVRKLEKVLAVYLKDPQNLPAARPTCKPSKKDRSYGTYPKGQKLDAIEYLTERIKELEVEIKEVRLSVDKRSSMPYGFASYSDIAEAHAIAYTTRKKKPHGATVALAPRPNDIIWDNMPLSAVTRSRRRVITNLWISALTVLWVAPNAMIAIFLVNLTNLGLVWSGFKKSLESNYTFWSLVQGIASPAITSLVYLLLPIFFRRLSIRAGDQTKTGRERHVTAKLYSFFVFNNLIVFSLFSSIWAFTAGVVSRTSSGTDTWQAILKENLGQTVLGTLCNISSFWITWLLQRQLGAAIDLAQLWTLFYSFIMRKFSSPTPRELIELTAPPPLDYASYYNSFLYYSTVALCYAGIQPLVVPAAALYFCLDVVLRKYLVLYIFVTKTESGGMFWRVLFNRLIFATILANLVVFLIVWSKGVGTHYQAYAVAPLPFLMVAFKIYCAKTFDDKIHFYSTRFVARGNNVEVGIAGKENLRSDRLAVRFGHPALYKPLITPMVHAKAQNILASVYQGRLTDGREAGSGDSGSVSGYSDTYALDPMHAGKPGKSATTMPGFEVVPESRLDFEYYKNREEFAEDHGAGEIFGRPSDLIRPGTPGTMFSGQSDSRPGTPVGGMGFAGRGRVFSPHAEPGVGRRSPSPGPGMAYSAGYGAYHGQSAPYGYSSANVTPSGEYPPQIPGLYGLDNGSATNLVGHAAPMASPPPPASGTRSGSREHSLDRGFSASPYGGDRPGSRGVGRTVPGSLGGLGGGPQGYGNLPQSEPEALDQDPMSYNYFRGGTSSRNRRDPGAPMG